MLQTKFLFLCWYFAMDCKNILSVLELHGCLKMFFPFFTT